MNNDAFMKAVETLHHIAKEAYDGKIMPIGDQVTGVCADGIVVLTMKQDTFKGSKPGDRNLDIKVYGGKPHDLTHLELGVIEKDDFRVGPKGKL